MTIGSSLPALLGYGPDGAPVTTAQFVGKPLIVYFYPKDNTPGCTAEACALRDGYSELRAMGYEVIGISKDSAVSHAKFAARHELPFLLLSDPDGEVNASYGVWQMKKMCGREYMGTVRTTFITDGSHTVTHIIRKVDTKQAARQIIDTIKG